MTEHVDPGYRQGPEPIQPANQVASGVNATHIETTVAS